MTRHPLAPAAPSVARAAMGFLAPVSAGLAAALLLGGCVMQSTYNSMLAQQQSMEAALRQEISADQVQIEALENGIRVRLADGLLYREGGVELSRGGEMALDKVARSLASQSDEIDVVGNTDDVPIGPELERRYPTNWELAAVRATIVVRHLQAQGVNPGLMRAISAGQYHPIASNDTPAGRARNRRTEILLRPH
jgi:chemotaxis protein MotB